MAFLCIEATDVRVCYGLRTVLDIEKFELYDGERVGLVGENGAGKSTFIKVLSGEITPDKGAVKRFGGVACISQMGDADEEMIGGRARSEFFAPEAREGLSGGERTRRRIAGALSAKARVLLADEPTVDLDIDGVEALYKRLSAFEGAIVLVSHDRNLLDSLCTRVCELTDGKLTDFPGSFSAYLAEKERRRAFERDEYARARAEKARVKEMIQRQTELASQKQHLPKRMGNSEARLHKREVTNAQARIHQSRKAFESRLDHMEDKKRPREDARISMALGATEGLTSRVAVEAHGLNLGFGARKLLVNADFTLPAHSKMALIGKNGCGKTTLLRALIEGNAPGIRVSPGVRFGYFGQAHEDVLDMDATAIENVMARSVLPESVARTVLARLNMCADDVFKRARVLSGGERAKVSLARLLVSNANALVLDEPTNHLDMFAREALESVLADYAGTLLFVSHDEYFVSKLADSLTFFEGQTLSYFAGSIADWTREKERRASGRALETLKTEITALEMRMATLSARLSAPRKGDNPELLNGEYLALAEEIREKKRALDCMRTPR